MIERIQIWHANQGNTGLHFKYPGSDAFYLPLITTIIVDIEVWWGVFK
jgi:hypothetical protein